MKFIRYGNKKVQHHSIDRNSFHTPPVEYGIYAFPEHVVEPFLLGGIGQGSIQNGRWQYLRYPDGKKVVASYNDIFTVKSEIINDEVLGWHNHYTQSYKKPFDVLCKGIKPGDLKAYDPNKKEESCVIEEIYIDNSKDKNADTQYNWLYETKPMKFNYTGNVWCHFIEHLKPYELIRISGTWCLIPEKLYKATLPKVINWMKYNYAMQSSNAFKHRPAGIPLRCFDKDIFEVFIEKIQ